LPASSRGPTVAQYRYFLADFLYTEPVVVRAQGRRGLRGQARLADQNMFRSWSRPKLRITYGSRALRLDACACPAACEGL